MTLSYLESRKCELCGKEDELRFGVCFECCHTAEARAARRSAWQHLKKAVTHLKRRQYILMRIDLKWSIQRLLRVGDYSRGGYFDREGHDWRPDSKKGTKTCQKKQL